MPSHLKLKERVGSNNSVDLRDIVPVKQAFNALGYYDPPEEGLTPYPDGQLFKVIREFQGDNGLFVDGAMRPGGETVRKLNQRMAQKQQMNPRIDPNMPIIRPGPSEKVKAKIREIQNKLEVLREKKDQLILKYPALKSQRERVKNKIEANNISIKIRKLEIELGILTGTVVES